MSGGTAGRAPVLVMTTGTAPVPGGGAAGWVSGDPAGMAGGALVKVSFDLGNDWRRYVAIQLGATAAGNTIDSMTAYGADAVGDMPLDRWISVPANTDGSVFNVGLGPGGSITACLRPMGRYVVLAIRNGAGAAQGAGARVSLAAYPA